VSREHELDRQRNQRAQGFDHLLAWHAPQPLIMVLETPTEVDEGIPTDDGSAALDPEQEIVRLPSRKRIDPERESVATRDHVRLERIVSEQPGHVRAAWIWLGDIHRCVETFHHALRVALVPGRGQDDHGLSSRCETLYLVRHRQWVEKEKALPVIERVRRHLRIPRLVLGPFRMSCLPVPEAGLKLAHRLILGGATCLRARKGSPARMVAETVGRWPSVSEERERQMFSVEV
jgi:hypothetical protein